VNFILTVRILPGMEIQQFVIPVDLAGPATLKVMRCRPGPGYLISILDKDGQKRAWFAGEVEDARFGEAA
jgi:hypothetical protein